MKYNRSAPSDVEVKALEWVIEIAFHIGFYETHPSRSFGVRLRVIATSTIVEVGVENATTRAETTTCSLHKDLMAFNNEGPRVASEQHINLLLTYFTTLPTDAFAANVAKGSPAGEAAPSKSGRLMVTGFAPFEFVSFPAKAGWVSIVDRTVDDLDVVAGLSDSSPSHATIVLSPARAGTNIQLLVNETLVDPVKSVASITLLLAAPGKFFEESEHVIVTLFRILGDRTSAITESKETAAATFPTESGT